MEPSWASAWWRRCKARNAVRRVHRAGTTDARDHAGRVHGPIDLLDQVRSRRSGDMADHASAGTRGRTGRSDRAAQALSRRFIPRFDHGRLWRPSSCCIAAPSRGVRRDALESGLIWLALSGGAFLLERAGPEPVVIERFAAKEVGDGVLRSDASSQHTRDLCRAIALRRAARRLKQARRGRVGAGSASEVDLRYLEHGAIAVGGPVTGRRYEFSSSNPVQVVDTRDAAVLVRTRFFRQA